MFHLIEFVIGNTIELGVGAAIGIAFKPQILSGVSAVKQKLFG